MSGLLIGIGYVFGFTVWQIVFRFVITGATDPKRDEARIVRRFALTACSWILLLESQPLRCSRLLDWSTGCSDGSGQFLDERPCSRREAPAGSLHRNRGADRSLMALKHAPDNLPSRLSRTGVVWGLMFGLSLPGVLTVPFWAPDSYVAHLVSTARGRGDAVVAIALIYGVAMYLLGKLGYPVFHEDDAEP